MTMRCEITYQGLKCHDGYWRCSNGPAPERGWVDIALEDLKKIEIVARNIPWRSCNGDEVPGGISIGAFNSRKPTLTYPGAVNAPAGGGLAPFGELVLKTYEDGALIDTTTYVDIHVDDSALEEITRDQADCAKHMTGMVRVPLIDIRKYYRDYGLLFSWINVRLQNGTYDAISLKGASVSAAAGGSGTIASSTQSRAGVPWTAKEAMELLFSQLPGSPIIIDKCDFRLEQNELPEPQDIRGEGQPAIEEIIKLLDRYGFIMQYLPSGNYAINRPFSLTAQQGKVSRGGGKIENGEHLNYELKTSTPTGRAPCVNVLGKRRVGRMHTPYIHVLPDTDGLYYKWQVVIKRWGHDEDWYRRQSTVGHEKQFKNVNPKFGGSGKLYAERREILRANAWKTYAPAFLWKDIPGDAPMPTPDNKSLQFVPFVDAGYYVSELAELNIRPPRDSEPKKGSRGPWFIRGPIIWARRFAQFYFKDIDQIDEFFKYKEKLFADEVTFFTNAIQAKANLISNAANRLKHFSDGMSSDDLTNATGSPTGGAVEGNPLLGLLGLLSGSDSKVKTNAKVVLDGDILKAITESSGLQANDFKLMQDYMTSKEFAAIDQIADVLKGKKELEAILNDVKKAQIAVKEHFASFKQSHQDCGAIPCWTNIPYGVLPSGIARISNETGLLQSSEMLCHINKSFMLDRESGEAEVAIGGGVMVSAGYEHRAGNVTDFTSVVIYGDDGDNPKAPAVPTIAGGGRAMPIKAKGESMDARLYETTEGGPINLKSVEQEAVKKVGAQFSLPRVVDGYTSEYAGLRSYVLDTGYTSVQYEWQGDNGKTFVCLNAPASRLTPQPAKFMRAGNTVQAEIKEQIKKEKFGK